MSTNKHEINAFFSDLNDIHANRHQYSLEWAFQDAQGRLDDFKAQVIDKKLKNKCQACKSRQNVQDSFTGLEKKSKTILKKTKWYGRLFANMFMILSFVEIMLSIGLVMGLSKLSHSGEAFIESEMISFWFITVFAFLKVAIERYQIKPRIDAWGWTLYEKSAKTLKEMTLALDEQAERSLIDIESKSSESDMEMTFRDFASDWMVA
eukprot:gnl/Carplike_NY0171/6785_a9335_123.p1 GENE.gnl/Carplike_NY0171/6785_a9335_123~~gnl/Carplike_NY0171/6785_a9335_123.p1  ORF type:complete len:207 (+),score=13.56 gnl/Carplike_NY0171/6785_a9335_123:223-843(+)